MAEQRPADPLRWLRDAIPENKDGGLSMLNIIRSALGTSANWLDGTKDPSRIGPEEMVAPLGLAGMGMAMAPKNSVGMFGGRLAQTADQNALATAEKMAATGAPREDVWKQTGWFQGVDGKWRFEIDDSKAYADMSGAIADGAKAGDKMPLGHVFGHGDAYKAYPGMDQTTLKLGDPGSNFGVNSKGSLVGAPIDASDVKARSFLLHEMQHLAQKKEGFAGGGHPDRDGMDTYKRLAGETESRTVEKRRDMSADERRARPPWMDYDVPEGQQIVRSVMADNAKGSAPGTVLNSLDMSEAARMQRAKEMGFDTGKTWYHGTDGAFDAFDPAKVGAIHGDYSTGFHMTRSPDEAASYGNAIMPLMSRVQNPYIMESARHHATAVHDLDRNFLFNEARKGGHDGILVRGRDGSENLVAFDPATIRSTQAAFDPAKRDSANLLAASPSASAPGLAANSTQQQTPPIDAELKRRLLDALMMGSPDA